MNPQMTTSNEPLPTGLAVRRFKDPAYVELAPNLQTLRDQIDDFDRQIVALLAARALRVRDATRFKKDAYQVSAPARQAEVFKKVRNLASAHADNFPGFEDVVESAYRSLVAGFIAAEQSLFSQTEEVTS
jgi:isochorismate pyruvate lyase